MSFFVPVVVMICLTISPRAEPPVKTDEKKLLRTLHQDCGSCHGLERKGGLGSSLEPEVMKKRNWQEIKAIILNGRPGTAMPPWRAILTDGEAEWMAKHLTGVPNGAR